MKKYERPDAIVIDEVSEGVYAASGATNVGNCWTLKVQSDQKWNGNGHTFRLIGKHSDSVEHISTCTTMVITFNMPVQVVECEFEATASGETVTVKREQHANAYQSGDNFNSLLVVKSTGDQALTESINCVSSTISCTKTANVQGRGGDGN